MALPSSGAISLSQVNVELGVSATATRSLGDTTTRNLFGVASGAISMSQGYGKANAMTVEYLVVGGGGASCPNGGGGGGGGAVLAGTTSVVMSGSSSVTVGAGGLGWIFISGRYGVSSVPRYATAGTASSFNGATAAGGQPGVLFYGSNAAGGASGSGFAGGVGVTAARRGGGGGGAGGAGQSAYQVYRSYAYGVGGAGVSSSITGASVVYGSGAQGSSDSINIDVGGRAGSQYGGGGSAGGYVQGSGTFTQPDGNPGIVVVAYAGAQKFTGGTVDTTSRPGYVIHTFTSSGSLTPL